MNFRSKPTNLEKRLHFIADAVFFLSGVICFVPVFSLVFPHEYLPIPQNNMVGEYHQYLVNNPDEFSKPWFKSLRYGVMMLTAFSAALFIKFWGYLYRAFPKKDLALFWFSLAMLSWGAGALVSIVVDSTYVHTAFSQINNLCFFLSFPYFKYGFSGKVMPLLNRLGVNEQNYEKKISLFFLIVLVSMCLPIFNKEDSSLLGWGSLGITVNFLLSLSVNFCLFLILWASFSHRKLEAVKWMTLIPMACMFIGELLNFLISTREGDVLLSKLYNHQNFNLYAMVAKAFVLTISKVTLIILVAGLAMSWLFEKIELQKNEMIHFVRNGLHQFVLDVQGTGNDFTNDVIVRLKNLRDIVQIVYLQSGDTAVELEIYLNQTLKSIKDTLRFSPIWDFGSLAGINFAGDPARNLGKLVTEMVLNAYKHGGKTAKIRADIDGDILSLSITDKGKPDFDFAVTPEAEGIGIKLFHIYLECLEATFRVLPEKDGKTLVINIPLNNFKI